ISLTWSTIQFPPASRPRRGLALLLFMSLEPQCMRPVNEKNRAQGKPFLRLAPSGLCWEISASGGIPRAITGNPVPTAGRKATALSFGNLDRLCRSAGELRERLECGQLAGAFEPPTAPQSGSKLHALQ